jgi:hypothetical protein
VASPRERAGDRQADDAGAEDEGGGWHSGSGWQRGHGGAYHVRGFRRVACDVTPTVSIAGPFGVRTLDWLLHESAVPWMGPRL